MAEQLAHKIINALFAEGHLIQTGIKLDGETLVRVRGAAPVIGTPEQQVDVAPNCLAPGDILNLTNGTIAKKKRHRRTNAQIAADRKMAEAVAQGHVPESNPEAVEALEDACGAPRGTISDPAAILDDVVPEDVEDEVPDDAHKFSKFFLMFWEKYPLGKEAKDMYETSKLFEKLPLNQKLTAINKAEEYAEAWKTATADRRKFIYGARRWVKERRFLDDRSAYEAEARGGPVGSTGPAAKASTRKTTEDRGGDDDESWIDETS